MLSETPFALVLVKIADTVAENKRDFAQRSYKS
jgi:hypothetical protein